MTTPDPSVNELVSGGAGGWGGGTYHIINLRFKFLIPSIEASPQFLMDHYFFLFTQPLTLDIYSFEKVGSFGRRIGVESMFE